MKQSEILKPQNLTPMKINETTVDVVGQKIWKIVQVCEYKFCGTQHRQWYAEDLSLKSFYNIFVFKISIIIS